MGFVVARIAIHEVVAIAGFDVIVAAVTVDHRAVRVVVAKHIAFFRAVCRSHYTPLCLTPWFSVMPDAPFH